MNANAKKTERSRVSVGKKFVFTGLICLFVLVSLEFASSFFLMEMQQSLSESLKSLRQDQEELSVSGRDQDSARETIHPYIGWTFNPDVDPGISTWGETVPVNERGLVDEIDSVQKKDEKRVIVAITGGSFAQQFAIEGADPLLKALQEQGTFEGRDVVIVRLAMAGFKQPQQLLLLSYLYSLGAEFDYVINIDGFNEGVLPATDNRPQNIHYSYPHRWNARLAETINPSESDVVFRLLQIRAERQRLAKRILQSPFRWSSLRNLVWKTRDGFLKDQIYQLELAFFHSREQGGDGFAVSGPPNPSYDSGAFDEAILNLWKESSLQMHKLCMMNETEYLHVLQPNQYLPGSKPLSDWEKEEAFAEGHDFKSQVEKIYPMMKQQSAWFEANGVKFFDLTLLFSDNQDSIYADWCCHVNTEGNEILASEIAQIIDRDQTNFGSGSRF